MDSLLGWKGEFKTKSNTKNIKDNLMYPKTQLIIVKCHMKIETEMLAEE